jgi:DNA-binding transcriptional regulator YiaG
MTIDELRNIAIELEDLQQAANNLRNRVLDFLKTRQKSSLITAEELKEIRDDLNMTSEAFADLMEISIRHLSRLENGRMRITDRVARRANKIKDGEIRPKWMKKN